MPSTTCQARKCSGKSRKVNEAIDCLDGTFDRDRSIIMEHDRFIRAYIHAPSTSTAPVIIDPCLVANDLDGVHETSATFARSAPNAPRLVNFHRDARHPRYLLPDLRGEIGQHPPQATTRATIADREQLVSRRHVQPYRVELVPAHQVDETRFAASPNVVLCFTTRHFASQRGIDTAGSIPKK